MPTVASDFSAATYKYQVLITSFHFCCQQREGLSQYNKIYEFNYNFRGRNAKMTMTSVSGHLLNHEFVGNYRRWNGCSPDSLFDAPVVKECSEDFVKIKVLGLLLL